MNPATTTWVDRSAPGNSPGRAHRTPWLRTRLPARSMLRRQDDHRRPPHDLWSGTAQVVHARWM